MKKHPVFSRSSPLPIYIALSVVFLTASLPPAFASDIQDHIDKGSRFVKARDYQRAIHEYEEALKLSPTNAKTHLLLGLVYANMNDLEKAIKYTTKALELDPSYSAYNNLALVYANKGDFPKAIDNYEKAIALNPSAFTPWYHLGLIYSSKKDYVKAAEHYKKATELNRSYGEAYVGLGSALYYTGDKAGAYEQVKRMRDLKLKTQSEGLEEWLQTKEKPASSTGSPQATPGPSSKPS